MVAGCPECNRVHAYVTDIMSGHVTFGREPAHSDVSSEPMWAHMHLNLIFFAVACAAVLGQS
jgi:uncharacterized protein (DUF983 family)